MKLLRRALVWQAALWAAFGLVLVIAPGWVIESVFDQPPLGEEAWLRVSGVMAITLAGLMVLVSHRVEELWWWSWAFVILDVGQHGGTGAQRARRRPRGGGVVALVGARGRERRIRADRAHRTRKDRDRAPARLTGSPTTAISDRGGHIREGAEVGEATRRVACEAGDDRKERCAATPTTSSRPRTPLM